MNLFKINHWHAGNIVPYETFGECNGNIRGKALDTVQSCGNGEGVIIKIGYEVNPFLELYHVCYNSSKSAAIYSAHVLYGESLNTKMNGIRDGTFKAGGQTFFTQTDLNNMYTQCNQVILFDDLFSPQQQFVCERVYFQRGHLAPYADFAMDSWKYSTNYFINVFPQWNTINNGNWGKVEDNVRDHARKSLRTFKVFTGTHELLQLNGKEIYLHPPNRIPVPKWSWKIIKDELADSGIAFITLNNPYYQAPTPPTSGDFCNDICASYNWDDDNFRTPSKGYTICCTVSDLMSRILTIPNEASVRNVLLKV